MSEIRRVVPFQSNVGRFDVNATDPTRTATVRKRYGSQLYKRYRAIQQAVSYYVGEQDILGLGDERPSANAGTGYPAPSPKGVPTVPPPESRYPFQTGDYDDRIREFRKWLDNAQEAVVLGDGGPTGNIWTDDYVRYAYSKGATQADAKLSALGIDVPESELAQLFNIPIHKSTLSLFYQRQYDALDGINQAVGKEISRTLAESFLAGENPRVAARRINDRISAIGITRARTLAQTEMIHVHSESTLNRFEQILGSSGTVVLKAEWITAGDDRVCPECESFEGQVFEISEARNLIPLHPRCRCTWLPARVDPETGDIIAPI